MLLAGVALDASMCTVVNGCRVKVPCVMSDELWCAASATTHESCLRLSERLYAIFNPRVEVYRKYFD